MDEKTLPRNLLTAGSTPVERIYFAWNDALSHNDADGLLALYAEDAGFESPLVPHVLGIDRGYLHGHKEIRPGHLQRRLRHVRSLREASSLINEVCATMTISAPRSCLVGR
jgi:ketosteroid isomerase-like protein